MMAGQGRRGCAWSPEGNREAVKGGRESFLLFRLPQLSSWNPRTRRPGLSFGHGVRKAARERGKGGNVQRWVRGKCATSDASIYRPRRHRTRARPENDVSRLGESEIEGGWGSWDAGESRQREDDVVGAMISCTPPKHPIPTHPFFRMAENELGARGRRRRDGSPGVKGGE